MTGARAMMRDRPMMHSQPQQPCVNCMPCLPILPRILQSQAITQHYDIMLPDQRDSLPELDHSFDSKTLQPPFTPSY